MTEERKKYMASISKEELIVRWEIIRHKSLIRDEKFWLNHVDGDTEKQIKETLWRIYCSKTILKALKKQLPAPRKRHVLVLCSVCGWDVNDYEDYCAYCGQKLR